MNSRFTNTFLNPIALGYLVFFILLAFSIVFYLERTCYADIAFQTFVIINTQNVFYQLDRFGAVFIHIFPLAAVLLHLPLKWILLSYSAAFVIQNIFFYWLLHKVLKQKEIALILVLYNVLMVTETFYWTTNEIKQGFSFCILFSGILLAMPAERFQGLKKYGLLALYLSVLIITIFLHNLVAFAVIFILGYFLIQFRKITWQSVIWSGLIVALILLVKYNFLPVSWYEAEKYELRKNFITYFPYYFNLPSFKIFLNHCRHDWFVYGFLFAAVTVFYGWGRQWLKLAYFLAFSTGYLIIVVVTHPIDAGKPFMESFYQALGIFVLFPFVIEMLPKLKSAHVLIILSVIFFLRLNKIYHTHLPYAERLSLIQETLARHEGKFIVPENYYPGDQLKMAWGAAYESALLTSMRSPDSCRSFVILNDLMLLKYIEQNNDDKNHFYTFFGTVPYQEFNPSYFRPAPGRYVILPRKNFFLKKKP